MVSKICMAALSAALLAGCWLNRAHTECPNLRWLAGSAKSRLFLHPNGREAARGKVLEGRGVAPPTAPPWQQSARVGEWTYWYDNGQKKAVVTYSLSCYVHCCSASSCPQVHDYPVGRFEMWHPTGEKLAAGTYVPVRRRVVTNCAGGAHTTRGELGESSTFWTKEGTALSLAEARQRGLIPEDL